MVCLVWELVKGGPAPLPLHTGRNLYYICENTYVAKKCVPVLFIVFPHFFKEKNTLSRLFRGRISISD